MSDRSYLDFEQPLADLEKKIAALRERAKAEGLDVTDAIEVHEKRRAKLEREIFRNLTRWQKYQLSRHPQRPYSLDYIDRITSDFIELHGDRCSGNDQAIVGGLAYFEDQPIVVIGQQKGRNTSENLKRNFGLPHPEGISQSPEVDAVGCQIWSARALYGRYAGRVSRSGFGTAEYIRSHCSQPF